MRIEHVGSGKALGLDMKDTNPKSNIGDKKLPLWLLSPIAKAHWALGQFAGLIKYGAWNWRAAGVRTSTYISAMHRHLDAYTSGEEYDPIDGSHHLGNIMACAAILLDAKAANKLTDDRPPSVELRTTYAAVEAQMAKLRVLYADKSPRHYTIADTITAALEEDEDGCPPHLAGHFPCEGCRVCRPDGSFVETGTRARFTGKAKSGHFGGLASARSRRAKKKA